MDRFANVLQIQNDTAASTEKWEAPTDYDLPDTTCVLYSPEGVKVILLGTAHISHKSVLEAQELVKNIRPQLVFVELCKSRQHLLNLPLDHAVDREPLDWTSLQREMGNSGFIGVVQLVLSNLTWTMAAKIGLEITPGTEFAAAYHEARQYQGIIALGDRDVQITLRRAWRALSIWEKLQLAWILITENFEEGDVTLEELERMKNSDIVTEMIQDLSKRFPGLVEPLIYERDRYLTYRLLQFCSKMDGFYQSPRELPPSTSERKTVVAIVGMGHVQGILKTWKNPVDKEDFRNIQTIPSTPLFESLLYYGTLSVTFGSVGYFIYRRLR